MITAATRGVLLGVALLLLSVLSFAQVAAPEEGAFGPGGNSARPVEDSGNSLLPAEVPLRFLLLYSADVSGRDSFPNGNAGGWDTTADGRVTLGVWRNKLRAYLGATGLVQHNALGTTGTLGANGFVGPTIGVAVPLTRRLIWDVSVSVGYGAQASRFFESIETPGCDANCGGSAGAQDYLALSQLQDDAFGASAIQLPAQVATLPLARPESLVILSSTNATQTLGVYGSTGLRWMLSPRRSVQVRISHSEGELLTGNPQSNDIASARIIDGHRINERTIAYDYAQYHHYFQMIGCSSYGGGGGASRYLTRSMSFSGEAGVELSQQSCGAGQRWSANYSGNLFARLTKTTRLSVGGGRDMSATYLPGSRWSDSVQASMRQEIGGRASAIVSFGYLRSAMSSSSEVYEGTVAWGRLFWRIARQLYAGASYAYFDSTVKNGPLGQHGFYNNTVAVSLSWRPPAHRL
jgi:hypothetical protein